MGDTLYLHGSTGATSLRATSEVCVTVTHLDALVLARSVFHHSMNYRSAVIYGHPRLVTSAEEKLAGLRAIVENLSPGRWDVARGPTRKELAATAVLALSLAEASVKRDPARRATTRRTTRWTSGPVSCRSRPPSARRYPTLASSQV